MSGDREKGRNKLMALVYINSNLLLTKQYLESQQ